MFTVNSKSFEGTARTVDKHAEHKLVGEIANLMNTKYGWSDGLVVELTPQKEQSKQILFNLEHTTKYNYRDVDQTGLDLYSIINFTKFEDIEHILQCIKEIDDFFSNSQYGDKYLLERE